MASATTVMVGVPATTPTPTVDAVAEAVQAMILPISSSCAFLAMR